MIVLVAELAAIPIRDDGESRAKDARRNHVHVRRSDLRTQAGNQSGLRCPPSV